MKPYGYVEYEYECLCDDKIYHIGHKALCQLWNLRKMQESVEAAQQTGISRHFQEQEQMTGIERHFEEME